MPVYTYATKHIERVISGDYFSRELVFTNYSLTGKNYKMQVRQINDEDSPVVLQFSSADGEITVSGSSLILTKLATLMKIQPGVYMYDIQSFTDSTDILTIVRGKFNVISQTTFS